MQLGSESIVKLLIQLDSVGVNQRHNSVSMCVPHAKKSFLILVDLNQIWIVITLFLIDLAQQTEFPLVHKSIIEKCKIEYKIGFE